MVVRVGAFVAACAADAEGLLLATALIVDPAVVGAVEVGAAQPLLPDFPYGRRG